MFIILCRRIKKNQAKVERREEEKLEREAPKKPSVPLIIKADNNGSLKTISDFVNLIPTDEVDISIVESSIGEITSSDIQRAQVFGAKIFGFNVLFPEKIADMSKMVNVKVQVHSLIYSLFEDIRAVASESLSPHETYQVYSVTQVVQVFPLNPGKKNAKSNGAAGCKVLKGSLEFNPDAKPGDRVGDLNLFRVLRDGQLVHQGPLFSLRFLKEEVPLIKKGGECGIVMKGFSDFKPGILFSLIFNLSVRRFN